MLRRLLPTNRGKRLLILAALGVMAVSLLYLVDVWLLGAFAAQLYSALVGLGSVFGPAEKKAFAKSVEALPGWILRHPTQVAWAWLTRSGAELTYPAVRTFWFGLNAVLGFCAVLAFVARRWERTIEGLRRKFRALIGIKPPEVLATARWAELRDVARVCDFGFGPGIVLGRLGRRVVRIPQRPKARHNMNVLVVGAPGHGKTRCYVIPNLLAAVRGMHSCIVTDPKGEIVRIAASWLRRKGYKVRVLNLVRPEISDLFNPLDQIRTPLDVDVFVQVVLDTTEPGEYRVGDQFWNRAEQNLLKALVLYVLYDERGARRRGTMAQVYDLLASGDPAAVDALFRRLPPRHPARAPYQVYAMADEKVRGNVVNGLGVRLQVFQQEAIRKLTAESTIDLELPGREPCVYFAVTPDTHRAFDFVASLFFTFLFIRLVEQADARPDGRLAVPVRFLLDEFANIVKIPEFNMKIATARGRMIECHVIVQSLPQLERVYGRHWEELRATCSTLVVLKVEDNYTANYVSAQLGQSTLEVASRSSRVNPVVGTDPFDRHESRTVTVRPLLRPDEVRSLPGGECIVFLPSPEGERSYPARLRLIDYTEFPEAAELGPGPDLLCVTGVAD